MKTLIKTQCLQCGKVITIIKQFEGKQYCDSVCEYKGSAFIENGEYTEQDNTN